MKELGPIQGIAKFAGAAALALGAEACTAPPSSPEDKLVREFVKAVAGRDYTAMSEATGRTAYNGSWNNGVWVGSPYQTKIPESVIRGLKDCRVIWIEWEQPFRRHPVFDATVKLEGPQCKTEKAFVMVAQKPDGEYRVDGIVTVPID